MTRRRSGIRNVLCLSIVAGTGLFTGPPATAYGIEDELTAVLVGTPFFPVFATYAPGDFERLFVVGKTGIISVIKNGQLLAQPFLDLTSVVYSVIGEQGLLGLAFHPDYQTNGCFFVYYTADDDPKTIENESIIERYEVSANPDVADPGTGQVVLTIPQPHYHHNAGWMGFSPIDGYLYIALGDGGGLLDPDDNAQNLEVLLGKILRIDVDCGGLPSEQSLNYTIPDDNPFVGIAGQDEIWAYGLRNPYRCSFDRETGDLYICDVGSNLVEEVNWQPAASAGGENYGWDCMEGTLCRGQDTCVCFSPSLTGPLYEYDHGANAAIVGGAVYRGCAIPELWGTFVWGDFFSGVKLLTHDGGNVTGTYDIDLPPAITQVTAFGEDAYGELYICDKLQGVFKLVPSNPKITDCNANLEPDACDILDGTSNDKNGDGVPDECAVPCPWDCGDGDAIVGVIDFLALLVEWGSSGSACDLGLGAPNVGIDEFLDLLAHWGPCP